MEKKRFNLKPMVGLVLAFVYLLVVVSTNLLFLPWGKSKVYAAGSVIAYAHVTEGVTNLRFRNSMDTSNTNNVITKVDGGQTMDVYSSEKDSSGDDWLYVAMNINNSYTYGYVYAEYVTIDSYVDNNTSDESFEDYLNRQGFPESYKDGLRHLHASYPNWVFIADKTGVDWNTLVDNENVLGRSLIYSSAASSWKSTASGCYDWNTGEYTQLDSGGWVQASEELVSYALDPRNFLTSTYIFMFEKLSFNSVQQTQEGLQSIISGSFMDGSNHDLSYDGTSYNYNSGLFLAGRMSGVSPYHLASRILQEQGFNGGGSSISGTVGGYAGYYNYYNQGAYSSGGTSTVVNGLKYASNNDSSSLRPWNTRMKSIVGGAILIGKGYINAGQDTIYYEKFDIKNFWHQYMTNILAARSESAIASNAYSETMKKNTALVFKIPVYDNMSDQVCDCPVGSGSANNKLRELSVSGCSLTPTFNKDTSSYSVIVDNSVSQIQINANAIDSGASVYGTGTYGLNVGENNFTVNVTAQNGNTRSYSIKIIRTQATTSGDSGSASGGSAGSGSGSSNSGSSAGSGSGGSNSGSSAGNAELNVTTSLKLNNNSNLVSGIGIGTSVDSVKQAVQVSNGYCKLVNTSGNDKSGVIATGDKLRIFDNNGNLKNEYTVIIYGDINGDGAVDLMDIVRLKKYIIGTTILDKCYVEAADANRNGTTDILDVVAIKRHLTGKKYIVE
ncbi:dockerin type I domain-containing protein [Lachnospira multipara]|uniref:dockerin type I domain-containing protein n=1 Tax=Lachnospira multipara TaxID=28051 RepID=UPI00068BC668|nr:dockerin type I domain-containing protein [Lachnospira multipara]